MLHKIKKTAAPNAVAIFQLGVKQNSGLLVVKPRQEM
jgi:hypothetical protein